MQITQAIYQVNSKEGTAQDLSKFRIRFLSEKSSTPSITAEEAAEKQKSLWRGLLVSQGKGKIPIQEVEAPTGPIIPFGGLDEMT